MLLVGFIISTYNSTLSHMQVCYTLAHTHTRYVTVQYLTCSFLAQLLPPRNFTVYAKVCSCSPDILHIIFSLTPFSTTLRTYWRQPTSRRLSVM